MFHPTDSARPTTRLAPRAMTDCEAIAAIGHDHVVVSGPIRSVAIPRMSIQ
jgi:hypothetical protein